MSRDGVGQPGDEVGVGDEDVAGQAARTQQLAEPPGHLGAVPERVGELQRPLLPRRQLAEAEQPEVGVGRRRQPVEHERQELLHHPRRPGEAPGQLPDRGPGPLGVGEPEAGQRVGRRLGRHPAGARQGVEQRPEVQPLVDRAHDVPLAGQISVERLGRSRLRAAPVAEDAGDAAPVIAVGGQGVRLALLLDLQRVLDPAEEPVGVGQPGGVVRVDVAGRVHLRQGREGGRRPQLGVGPAVDELQGLHRELDVADAAGRPLDLPVAGTPPAGLALCPGPQRPERPQVVGGQPLAPQADRRRRRPLPADLGVAGHRRGLEQGLELPGLGPAVPVGDVAVERPGQGAVPALGPQVGVDPEAAPGDVHDRPGVAGVALHEQQVDVAGVVELPAAELAHPDHRQPLDPHQPDRGVQHGRRLVGQGRGRLLQGVEAEQVAGGDPELRQPLPPGQLVGVGRVLGAAGGRGVEGGQHVERRRVGLDQPGCAAARRRHGHQRLGQGGRGRQPVHDVAVEPLDRHPHRGRVGAPLDQLDHRRRGAHADECARPVRWTPWPACASRSARSTRRSATSPETPTGCSPRSPRPRTPAATSPCSPSWR